MAAHIHAGALGRPVEEFAHALNICAAEWRADPDNPWISGMVAAGWWICGYLEEPPLRHGEPTPASGSELSEELRLTFRLVHGPEHAGSGESHYARGVARMIMYAKGLTSELPMVPTGRLRATA